jgi:ABC-type phosphate/phosphonate transport system substrate-binding protein
MAASIGVPAPVRPVLASSSSGPTSTTIASSEPTPPLTLGALPHHSLLQLEAFYAPLAMYLSECLQRSVRFGTSSSYARFEARLARRDFDIVFIDSLDYVRLAGPAGYTALVRRTVPTAVIYIVAADSPLRSLGDLRGATVAMPPDVAPETLLGLERLRAVGLDPTRDVTIHYLPHHNACIQHVAAGRAAACVTTTDALAFVGAEAGKDYRVLERVGTIPPALFAVAPSLSAAERDRLAEALIAWPGRSEREGGPANLEWFALEPATDAEFESLRRSLPQAAERGANSGPAGER